jgi:hypothetical protein
MAVVSVTTMSDDKTSFRLFDKIRRWEISRPGRKYKATSAQDDKLDVLQFARVFPLRILDTVDFMVTFKSTVWWGGLDRTCMAPEKRLGSPLFCVLVLLKSKCSRLGIW